MKIVSYLSFVSLIALCGVTQLHANGSDDKSGSGIASRSRSSSNSASETVSQQTQVSTATKSSAAVRQYLFPEPGDPRFKHIEESCEDLEALGDIEVPHNYSAKSAEYYKELASIKNPLKRLIHRMFAS